MDPKLFLLTENRALLKLIFIGFYVKKNSEEKTGKESKIGV